LPAHSVGSKQLKRSAVTRSKIKRSAVSRSKIKANAISASKVASNALGGNDINESKLGEVPQAKHASSAAALDKLTYKAAAGTAAAGGSGTATATCNAGQHVVGGGVKVANPAAASVDDSYPDVNNTAWSAHVSTDSGAPAVAFTVTAICASASSVG
jgi:hypothetical protein